MNWIIERNLVCPSTGCGFALMSGSENLHMILWYKGGDYLRAYDVLKSSDFGFVINDRIRNIKCLHLFPFDSSLWRTFEKTLSCPGNHDPLLNTCPRKGTCKIPLCPFGVQ